MAWINKLKEKFKKKRVLVIGLDGVPYTFLTHPKNNGKFPFMQSLFHQEGELHRMRSVFPTVSSVAWSSFMTGANPAKHNIYGFIDRTPNPLDFFIPTNNNMQSPALWHILSEAKKRSIVINVPVTYPPKPVNGILISGFLATNIDKCAYPASIVPTLKELDYQIDVDAWLARKDKKKFLEALHHTLERRFATAIHFLQKEMWDYFQLHVMGTDRINHFLFDTWENDHPELGPEFIRYFQKIDEHLASIYHQFVEKSPEIDFILLSDHGFCKIQQEVFLNQWLKENNWLQFISDKPSSLKDMHPATKAYSLIPGRIFINLKGREQSGQVKPGNDYEDTRNQLIESLSDLKDPETGQKIISKVVKREEIYEGPHIDKAADLIAIPVDGYDLKGNVDKDSLFGRSQLTGMHTYDDAFLYIKGKKIIEKNFDICALAPTILTFMGIPIPAHFDRAPLTIEE